MKKRYLNQRWMYFTPLLVVFFSLMLVASTFAQQNGTRCMSNFMNGPDVNMALVLDSTCDSNGDPIMESWAGSGPRSGCYVADDQSYGLSVSCDPCPSNWQNCTPCNDGASTCGDDTPDPQPTPTP
jgi:hypothetical protein